MVKPLIFGISSTKLTENEIKLFQNNPCLGFIIFSRNIESKQQLSALINTLRNLYKHDIYILMDQEGGRVARLRPPIAQKMYPAAQYFADLYDHDTVEALVAVKENYTQLMLELKTLGIDSPCAPVCDLLWPNASLVIGDRSFGAQPDKVIKLCNASIQGIIQAKGLPILKHIPGHGRAMVDSHDGLPIVAKSLNQLETTDFKVFRALSLLMQTELLPQQTAWAMTAHIVYKCLDPELPLTVSKIGIDYIRNKIHFTGKLISDDLGMFALHGDVGHKLSVLKRVVASLQKQKTEDITILALQQHVDEISKLFGCDIMLGHNTLQNKDLIINICNNKILELRPYFLENLAKITSMSIEAGCDIVLHCSGDLAEMQAICDVV